MKNFPNFPTLTSDSQDCPPLPRPEPRLATVGVYPSLPLVPAPTSRISVDYTLYDESGHPRTITSGGIIEGGGIEAYIGTFLEQSSVFHIHSTGQPSPV